MDTTTPVSVLMIVFLVLFTLYYCLMFMSCCILKFQTSTFNIYDLCKLVSCFVMLMHTCVSPIDSLLKIVHRQPEITQVQNERANTHGEIAHGELAT